MCTGTTFSNLCDIIKMSELIRLPVLIIHEIVFQETCALHMFMHIKNVHQHLSDIFVLCKMARKLAEITSQDTWHFFKVIMTYQSPWCKNIVH